MSGTIRLVEHREIFLARDAFTDDEGMFLHDRYRDQVAVEFPSRLTGDRWLLRSQGWVGYLPLQRGRGIVLEPKVPIRNLFRMLDYAFDLKSFRILRGTYEGDSIPEFFDRLALLLADRVLSRARNGLYRAYLPRQEALPAVRGRLDLVGALRSPASLALPCEFEELSLDLPENRILAWTLHRILQSGACTERSLGRVRMADRVLRGSVGLEPFEGQDCLGRTYNRLNADYQEMHLLCRFFLDCLGPRLGEGGRDMIPFLIDMARLFEQFVARWMETHLDSRYFLKTQLRKNLGPGGITLTPDLVLFDRESRAPLCILDTKYKGSGTVDPDDFYQVNTYAEALHCPRAYLVYPKSLEQRFNVQPNRIRVKSVVFDLAEDLEVSGHAMLGAILSELDSQVRLPLG